MTTRRKPKVSEKVMPATANLKGKFPFTMDDRSVIYAESREKAEDFFRRVQEARTPIMDRDKMF